MASDQGFVGRLRVAMEARRHVLSQGKVEAAAKLGDGYMSKLLRGQRRPSADIVLRLARVLEVDPGWLLSGEGPAPDAAKDAQPKTTTTFEPMSRYPNRDLAATVWRSRMESRAEPAQIDETIERLSRVALHADTDPSPGEWWDALEATFDLVRRESQATVDGPVAGPDNDRLKFKRPPRR